MSAKGVVGFSDLLSVSVTAGSTAGLGLGIDNAARKRFGSTTHPRKWLRVNEAGKLNYITVRLISLYIAISPTLLLSLYLPLLPNTPADFKQYLQYVSR